MQPQELVFAPRVGQVHIDRLPVEGPRARKVFDLEGPANCVAQRAILLTLRRCAAEQLRSEEMTSLLNTSTLLWMWSRTARCSALSSAQPLASVHLFRHVQAEHHHSVHARVLAAKGLEDEAAVAGCGDPVA